HRAVALTSSAKVAKMMMTLRVFMAVSLLSCLVHVAERVHQVQEGGAEDDDEERREEEEGERHQQLDRRLLCGLLGALPPLRAEAVGVDAHGARDGGAEAVGLDEHGDQALEVVDAGALR